MRVATHCGESARLFKYFMKPAATTKKILNSVDCYLQGEVDVHYRLGFLGEPNVKVPGEENR